MNYIYSFYLNTLLLGYETNPFTLCREIFNNCFENHTKYRNATCGHNIEFMNVQSGSI